jgi:hypothetical protein
MERQIVGSKQVLSIKEGDKVQLVDGRTLTVSETNTGNGKVKLVGDDGSVVFSNPRDILRIMEEVVEAVEKAKGLWAWLRSTVLVKIIVGFFKKKNDGN